MNLSYMSLKINGNKTINHGKIKAKLGLTDKKNHNIFYMEGGAFITPNVELYDFVDVMTDVETMCKRSIKKKIFNNNFLEPNFLMNFEVCSDRMKKNKNSYLSFQYHFKQKDGLNLSILDIKKNHEDFFQDLLIDMENEISKYDISISKQRKC
jgi:hypothetical protein